MTAVTVETGRVVATVRNTGSLPRSGSVRSCSTAVRWPVGGLQSRPAPRSRSRSSWRAPDGGHARRRGRRSGRATGGQHPLRVAAGRRSPTALIVTAGGANAASAAAKPPALYLSRALGASSGGDVDVRLDVRHSHLDRRRRRWRRIRAVALLSTRGLERAARERLMDFVRAGGGLLIAAARTSSRRSSPRCFGWQPQR